MFLSPERHIAHLDLDTFFVSVEELRNPKIKNKPVLIGGSSDRGVVAACSYTARKFGIHSAMPMREALRLCRDSIVLKVDYDEYSKYSRLVTEVVAENSPLFEKASIDEFYIDLTGTDKFLGSQKLIHELKNRVYKESGLIASYGLASNKLISKIATNEVKPNGQLEIPFGDEKEFLAPLSIVKIPGIGAETGYKLINMGVQTVRKLRQIPVERLMTLLGKNGRQIWRHAQGIDESPVIPYSEQKSISTQSTFESDTIDIAFLESHLSNMVEQISFELRQQNKLTGCITVKIRYSNFDTFTKQRTIAYCNSDKELLSVAKELFRRLYEKRLLIRLIGIKFSDLIPGNYQINLFEDTHEMIKLYQAVDSVKKQFGEKLLRKGSSFGVMSTRR